MATPVEVDGIFEDAVILQDMIAVTAFGLTPDPTIFESPGQPADYVNVAAIRPFQAPPTPPTIDPYFDNVQLLMHMNESNGSTTFTDNSSYSVPTIANGDAQITVTESKFGGASAVFDGDDDYVDITATPGFDFATNNFTVEFWIKTTFDATGLGVFPRVLSPQLWNSNLGNFQIWQASNTTSGKVVNAIELGLPNEAGAVVSTMEPVNDGEWHHIAFTRSAETTRVFLDGVLKDTANDEYNYSLAGTSGFRLGARGTAAPASIAYYNTRLTGSYPAGPGQWYYNNWPTNSFIYLWPVDANGVNRSSLYSGRGTPGNVWLSKNGTSWSLAKYAYVNLQSGNYKIYGPDGDGLQAGAVAHSLNTTVLYLAFENPTIVPEASGFLNAYIDDLRITKGVARYLNDFNVPTAAFGDVGLTQGETSSLSPGWRRPYKEIG